jgi:hypothetical protein
MDKQEVSISSFFSHLIAPARANDAEIALGSTEMIRLRLRNLWLRRGAEIAAISTLAALFMILFWRAIFGGAIILFGDPLAYSYPISTVAWEMIRNGAPPLWTPLILSGYPLLSMAQLALGYPLTWGYLFLPGHWTEHVFVLAPYLLAPIFTYTYAREMGRSRFASAPAGLSFGYGRLMVGWIGLDGLMSNAVRSHHKEADFCLDNVEYLT